MLRICSAMLGLVFLLLTLPAQAGQAGQIIFVAGTVQVAGAPAREGNPVQEGDLLETGVDGFLYIKTIDDGLFILRPKTQARIARYFVDTVKPSNTQVKFELISGVARSRSGTAVKHARQNFRFNTPVAAIGVRGTDFTVFTDRDTSRVSVLSGGIVVSGFSGACSPEGLGPCEGVSSRELSAQQRGVLLQIRRGQAAPQLMNGGIGPDQVAPPQPGEPGLKADPADGKTTLEAATPSVSLDPKKNQNLAEAGVLVPTPGKPGAPSAPGAPGDGMTPPPELPEVTPPIVQEDQRVLWGRWQPLLGADPTIDFEQASAQSRMVAVKGNYVLFTSAGKEFVSPSDGTVGFKLQQGEAYVEYDNPDKGAGEMARLENGKLTVDFGKRTFATSFDAFTKNQGINLSATGTVGANGFLYGDQALGVQGKMDVQGALSNADGGSAAYIFSGRFSPEKSISGVTYWRQ